MSLMIANRETPRGAVIASRVVLGSRVALDRRDRPADVLEDAPRVVLAAVLGGDVVSLFLPDTAHGLCDPGVSAGERVDQGHPPPRHRLDLRGHRINALLHRGAD